MKTALVHSDAYKRFDYGPEHPLRMERLGLTFGLMEAYGLTRLAGHRGPAAGSRRGGGGRGSSTTTSISPCCGRPAPASPVPDAYRYGLGPGDNPIWPGVYEASVLACGGSILAAELVARGDVARAFAFAGGLHHAMPARASGFCYLNDAVLAILALRRHGLRVAYVDIDAHHGDGVQAAFYRSADVLTISTHERGDRLFPGTGAVEELGEGPGRGYSVNLPLNPYTDDAVYLDAFDAVVPPVLRAFRADVVVAQLGIDGHRTDPLTHLALSVDGFAEAVRRIVGLAPRLVALGGGGYDLSNVARAWTVAWAIMNGVTLPPELPPGFVVDAAPYLHGRRTLWDPPAVLPVEAVRPAREFAERQIAELRRRVFPLLGVPPAGA